MECNLEMQSAPVAMEEMQTDSVSWPVQDQLAANAAAASVAPIPEEQHARKKLCKPNGNSDQKLAAIRDDMMHFMSISLGAQAEQHPNLVHQACASASKLIEWSADRVKVDIQEQITEIQEVVDSHDEKLDLMAKQLADVNLNHA